MTTEEEKKQERKEDEFVSCPAAAQNAVGRTVSTVARRIVANVSTLSEQYFFPALNFKKLIFQDQTLC